MLRVPGAAAPGPGGASEIWVVSPARRRAGRWSHPSPCPRRGSAGGHILLRVRVRPSREGLAWLGLSYIIMIGLLFRAGMKRAHREPGRHTPLCVANQINPCPAGAQRAPGLAKGARVRAPMRAPTLPRHASSALADICQPVARVARLQVHTSCGLEEWVSPRVPVGGVYQDASASSRTLNPLDPTCRSCGPATHRCRAVSFPQFPAAGFTEEG
jgi:hypothetical protein